MLAVFFTACDDDENLDRDPRIFTIADSGKLTGLTNQYVIITVPADMPSVEIKMVSDGKISLETEKTVAGVSESPVAGYTFEDRVVQDEIAYTRDGKMKPRYLQAFRFDVATPLVARVDTAEYIVDCVLPNDASKTSKAIVAIVGGAEYSLKTQSLSTAQLELLKNN